MYIDAQLLFSSAQAVTASAASTNVVDLGSNRELGQSNGIFVYLGVGSSATAAGAATVQFQLQGATDAGFTSPIILTETDAIPVASLAAGYVNYLVMPLSIGINYRYLRVFYNVGTGPLTAGTFNSEVVQGPQANRAYAAPYQA